ncbi:MAG TPA: hypothetical protein QGF35_01760 [Dehalococcoidia bacterium]|nr:hypothetical protein [Dehalococcoidia bacterium]
MALSEIYFLTFAIMFIQGINGGFFTNLNLTLIQSHTPGVVMGCVMAVYAITMMGGSPLGALIAGGGSDLVGPGEWFAIAGAAMTLIAAFFVVTQPGLRRMSVRKEPAVV